MLGLIKLRHEAGISKFGSDKSSSINHASSAKQMILSQRATAESNPERGFN